MFLYLSREFNFQTSLVNCDCTCGPGDESRSGSPTSSGKLARFYAPSGLPRRRFDLRSGKSRVNFQPCFANGTSRFVAGIYWLFVYVFRLPFPFGGAADTVAPRALLRSDLRNYFSFALLSSLYDFFEFYPLGGYSRCV